MSSNRVLKPAVGLFYLFVVLEFLFMISPFALHFYAAYGPALNLLHASPASSWLTGFFLPHFSITASPFLNSLKGIGFLLAGLGLLAFVVGAVQVYGAKLLRRGAVTGGLYRWVRHPQYLALVVLGFGVVLIWPRFLVLISYVVMVFVYYALARFEEQRCLEHYGDGYREYLGRTGRILPGLPWLRGRTGAAPAPLRPARIAAATIAALAVTLTLAFALRSFSLARVAGVYFESTAVLSPAPLADDELREAYRVASSTPELERRVRPGDRLVVYVVPVGWFLPDLPLHTEEEIRRSEGGHFTPLKFDRGRLEVLFTRARLHGNAAGRDIVTRAHGRDPILIVRVDLTSSAVVETEEPPDHVIWGDIPTPMF